MKLSAYSRLKRLLEKQQLSVPELHRRMRSRGFQVNIKSLYRLSDEDQAVQRLDLQVAGAICQVCAVPLSEWIVFEQDDGWLRPLAADRQARPDLLMAKNSAGQMTEAERSEVPTLVREAEEINLASGSSSDPRSPRPAAAPAPSGEDEQTARNERRIHLIRKRTRKGLSDLEEAELRQLQKAVRQHIDAAHPLPTGFLREMWQEVQQAASRLPEQTPEK